MAEAKKKQPVKKKPTAKKPASANGPVKSPHNMGKAVLAVHFYLREPLLKDVATLAGIGVTTLNRWMKSKWFWDMVEKESNEEWFKELGCDAKRTVKLQTRDLERDTAKWVLERTDPRFVPPKQQIEMSQGWISRDEAVKAFKQLAEAVADIVDDDDKRRAVVAKARQILTPLMAAPELPDA